MFVDLYENGTSTATNVLSIVDNGKVGITNDSPETSLHIKSFNDDGDAILRIEADPDDDTENDNPVIQFIQDGGGVSSEIGKGGDDVTGSKFTGMLSNSFYIHSGASLSSDETTGANRPLQFATNNVARMTFFIRWKHWYWDNHSKC